MRQARLRWTWIVPLLAALILLVTVIHPAGITFTLAAVALVGAVFAAVHHAEVIAHKVGEPFGTLILAIAVTVIEVALIVSIMLSAGPDKAGLARDTVFAAVMIVCNGIVGLCLLLGGVRHHEQGFEVQGASAALGVLCALSTLTLILPNYLTSAPGPALSSPQLVFVGIISLVLYVIFVFVQTVRHRDYFLAKGQDSEETYLPPPSTRAAWGSAALMLVSLIAVVGLAKMLSAVVEKTVQSIGAPEAVVGIVIATLVLLPEGFAALRAARMNRLQNSLNLALGSALASIGLTIPTVAAVSLLMGQPIALGIPAKDTVMLWLTLLVSVITLGTGRTTVLQGAIHLIIFASFLFLAVVP